MIVFVPLTIGKQANALTDSLGLLSNAQYPLLKQVPTLLKLKWKRLEPVVQTVYDTLLMQSEVTLLAYHVT